LKLIKPVLPLIMRTHGSLPSLWVEFSFPNKPGVKDHLGQKNQVALLSFHMSHEPFPIPAKALLTIAYLTDSNFHLAIFCLSD
jgi:hypothetical protein